MIEMKHLISTAALTWAFSGVWAQQAGKFTLDGWPEEKGAYFAGKTEVIVEGTRMKITEWPEDSKADEETLETYVLGKSVVRVFQWHGKRVGLVEESVDMPPRPYVDPNGQLQLPPPFPNLYEEGGISCGQSCMYHVRNVSFVPLDPATFVPGGQHGSTMVPPDDIQLYTKASFLAQFDLLPANWSTLD